MLMYTMVHIEFNEHLPPGT